MKRVVSFFTMAVIAATAFIATPAQDKADSLVGAVTNIDAAGRKLMLKTDAGAIVLIQADDNTQYLRLPAGERTLNKATPTKLEEIAINDRILARGTKSAEAFLAQRLIVMPATEVAKKREHDLEEWKRRGIGGIVREVNSQNGEITLELRGTGAGRRVPIQTTNATFRRYEPGSLRFEDARASKVAEVHVGDQLRALGDQNAETKTFVAEQIVSGAFKTIGVTVTNVDQATGQITAVTLDQKKPVTIATNRESVLHRISATVASAIAQKAKGDPGKTSGPTSAAKTGAPVIDVQQMIDSLPTIALADLKPGDVLAVTGAVGNDESHLFAIKLAAGVDLVLKALAPAPGKPQTVRLSAGLPTVFDFSVIPVN